MEKRNKNPANIPMNGEMGEGFSYVEKSFVAEKKNHRLRLYYYGLHHFSLGSKSTSIKHTAIYNSSIFSEKW